MKFSGNSRKMFTRKFSVSSVEMARKCVIKAPYIKENHYLATSSAQRREKMGRKIFYKLHNDDKCHEKKHGGKLWRNLVVFSRSLQFSIISFYSQKTLSCSESSRLLPWKRVFANNVRGEMKNLLLQKVILATSNQLFADVMMLTTIAQSFILYLFITAQVRLLRDTRVNLTFKFNVDIFVDMAFVSGLFYFRAFLRQQNHSTIRKLPSSFNLHYCRLFLVPRRAPATHVEISQNS